MRQFKGYLKSRGIISNLGKTASGMAALLIVTVCAAVLTQAGVNAAEPYMITEDLSDAISTALEDISLSSRSVRQIVFIGEYSGELTLAVDETAAGEKSNKVLLLQLSVDGADSGTHGAAKTAGEDNSAVTVNTAVNTAEADDGAAKTTGADNDVSFFPEPELTLTGSSMISETGEITFTIASTADGVLVYGVNGDVDGDEDVDASDTLAILRGVSGRTSLDVVEEGFADVNLDGAVNSNDLLSVVKYVSGRTSELN